jgi:hypothetical protein
MGETHGVSISSEGAPAPEAPQVNVTARTPGGITVSSPAPQAPQEEPQEEPAATPERPEWLDPKFESAEDLAKAYAELQARMGATEEPEAAPVEEGAGVTTEALQPFSEEYYSTGGLTDESFAKLEAMGLSRDLVEAFMEGQKAVQSAELNQIYAQAGGEEAYAHALAWAAQNMAGGQDVEPTLLPTEPTGKSGSVYESVAQLTADMKRPEYKSDPAFRAQVAKRLERSNIM